MTRYLLCVAFYVPFWFVAMLLAPILPAFAVRRVGPLNNSGAVGVDWRLPLWLAWFDTDHDNGLSGDEGGQTKHCPKYWGTYWGRVLWLWRNPAAGVSWGLLAYPVGLDEALNVASSGQGLDLDKSRPGGGWFKVSAGGGGFHYRSVRHVGRFQISFESGWLLDVYVKNPSNRTKQPRAPFTFAPLVRYHSG